MPDLQISPAEAAAIHMQRQKMCGSLVGFAECIKIPGAPLVEDIDLDDPESWEDRDRFGRVENSKISEDILGNRIAAWSRGKAEARCEPGYNHLFLPVGSGLALHHRILMEELERCMATRYGRLMVFTPPGAAKSTYCSVVAPTWKMGMCPGLQIILASYATPIAKKHGSKGRMIVTQDCYQGAFNSTIKQDTQAKELWHTTNGSEYMSGGILSGMTGNRAGGVIIDDPVKGRMAADSKRERERTLEAYEDDLKTRTIPGAWMVLVQTRWNYEDLAGSILPEDYDGRSGDIMCRDGLVWRVINMPGKCEHEDDPLGREIGEYMWPEWFDEQFWAMYEPREGDPNSPSKRTWASLFQQRPRPESGNMFEKEWFDAGRFDLGTQTDQLNNYLASDYATQEDEGDFTEHGNFGVDCDGEVWITDWFYGQVTTDIGIDELLKMKKRNQSIKGFGEMGIIRHAIEPAFKRRQRELKIQMLVDYITTAGGKGSRALSFQSLARSGKVHIPNCPWGDRLIEQLCDFPGRSTDDAVDVCSIFARAFENIVWARVLCPKKREPGLRPYSWEWLTFNERERNLKPRSF